MYGKLCPVTPNVDVDAAYLLRVGHRSFTVKSCIYFRLKGTHTAVANKYDGLRWPGFLDMRLNCTQPGSSPLCH